MSPRRPPRIATVALAIVAVAVVGGSGDPLGPSGLAGRRWDPAAHPSGPALADAAIHPIVALADHRGRRWR